MAGCALTKKEVPVVAKGQKVNSEVYIPDCDENFHEIMDGENRSRKTLLSFSRTARQSTRPGLGLRENLPEFGEKEVWPSYSPDCDLLD